MTTKATTAKVKATFKAGLCHHRNEQGAPDCRKPVVRASANLCEAHQIAWSKAAKERAADRKASKPASSKPEAKVVKLADRKPAPAPERKAHPRIAAMVAVEPEVTKVD
jgi:hypothetical protein